MVNLPKKRGRPRKIPRSSGNPFGDAFGDMLGEYSPEKQGFAREIFGDAFLTDRTRANAYYADQARVVVQDFLQQMAGSTIPDPAHVAKLRRGLEWILARRTVLNDLGRMLVDNPTDQDSEQLFSTVHHIALRHDKLTAKAACAYIRGRRMGDTGVTRSARIASLHHALNAAINVHRQRYPESNWAEVKRALDLSTKQIEYKLR